MISPQSLGCQHPMEADLMKHVRIENIMILLILYVKIKTSKNYKPLYSKQEFLANVNLLNKNGLFRDYTWHQIPDIQIAEPSEI